MQRMSTADATIHWLSATHPSDTFTILCIDAPGAPISMDAVVRQLYERAQRVDDLCLGVLNVPGDLDRPYWVRSEVRPDAFVVHSARTWRDCLDKVGELADDQLDPTENTWRIHVFGPLTGAPRGWADKDGEAIVVALQISHTLGDGRAIAAICLGLFDAARPEGPARAVVSGSGRPQLLRWRLAAAGMACLPVSVGATAFRWLRWNIEYRKALRSGWLTSWPTGAPPTELNRSPGPGRTVRVIVLDRRSFPTGYSVTAAILTAISYAVDELIGPASRRTAVVPVALPLQPGSHNNVVNVSIDLHVEIDAVGERMSRIADELTAIQKRASAPNPVLDAAVRFDSAVPAFLMRRGLRRFVTDAAPDIVPGVTIVSSVNTESADLSPVGSRPDLPLAGGKIRFATGFPYLTESMGLGHGVIGVGAVVTISVITSPDIVDADAYVDMLRRALDRVAAGGSPQP